MSQPESTADKTPTPVRYRWLKRISVGCVVLLVALVLLRLWWGRVADRRLQAEIDRIIAAGEPLFPEDFNSPPIPDDTNAAVLLKQAAVPWENSGATTLELPASPQPGPEYEMPPGPGNWLDPDPAYWAEAEAAVKAHAKALALIRKARSMPDAEWGLRFTSPTLTLLLPFLGGQRNMARFVCGVARYQHHTGRHDEAVEVLRDALAMGTALDRHPTLIGHMVAEAARGLARMTIESILPTLSIESAVAPSPLVGQPATRAHIQALIRELLDAEPRQAALVRTFQSERMMQLDTVTLLAEGKMSFATLVAMGGATPPAVTMPRSVVWPVKPLLLLDGARSLLRSARVIDAARQLTWRDVLDRLPSEPMEATGLRKMTHLFSLTLTPTFSRAMQIHFRGFAQDRMTAVALALRLYELDHGRRPRTLDALVPDYLPRIPDDPFGTNGRPIRYRPDAHPPVLYSVGIDQQDDDGAFVVESGRILDTRKDIPFFLNGNRPRQLRPGAVAPPATAPSTQALENDEDLSDDERNADQRADGQVEP